MADQSDVIKGGNVSAPDLGSDFPTLDEQRGYMPPEKHSMNDVRSDEPNSTEKKEYGIFGGASYVPERGYTSLSGEQKSYENFQGYMAVQTFVSPTFSYVFGTNLNNPYGDDSLVLTGCAETERMGHTVSLGACAGVEYGLDEQVSPDVLINGQNFTPKAELYMMLRSEKFTPELKVGVENLPTPQGSHDPVYTVQVRFPLPK